MSILADKSDYEEIIDEIGGVGYYQIYANILVLLIVLGFGSQVGFMIFGAIVPNPACLEFNLTNANCTIIDDSPFHSIAVEWDLTGPNRFLLTIITSLQMIGILIGCLVIGTVADRFGRKISLIGTTLGSLVFSILTAFSAHWVMFTVLRTIDGAFAGAAMIVAYCYVAEILPPEWRLFCTAGYQWTLSFVWLAVLGKFARHWQVLSFAISSTTVPAFLMTLFTTESPKWLLERREYSKAKDAFFKIASWNRKFKETKQSIDDFVQDEKADQGVHYVQVLLHARPSIASRRMSRSQRWSLAPTFTPSLSRLNFARPSNFNRASTRYSLVRGSLALNNVRGSIARRLSVASAYTSPMDFIPNDPEKDTKKTYTYLDLFYNRTASVRALAYAYSWFATSLTAYGFSYNISNLAGDTSNNVLICCALELFSSTILIVLDRKMPQFGRRTVLQIGLGMHGLCTLLMAIFYATKLDLVNAWSVRTVSFVGYGMCSFVWTPIILYGFELFPTTLRNTGMAMGSMAARIGACLSPQILSIYYVWKPGPFLLFTFTTLINVVLAMCFLPETKNQPLPDFLHEKPTNNNNDVKNGTIIEDSV